MTYLSGKQHKKKKNVRYFLYISFFAVVVIFWTVFKSKLYPILEPAVMKYGVTKDIIAKVPDFFSTYVTSRRTLIQKDKILEVTIENLENEIAEKDGKLKELGLVTSDLGDTAAPSTLVLYPIMSDITRLYSTVLLSKGYKDGVEKDMYVYVRGLQPVCIIKEVYTSTSLCQLISAGGVATEAVTQNALGTTTIALTLTGRGGGTFLGDVERDTPIAIGDSVFLKSDQTMKLGTVVDVIHNNQDTSWHVFVSGAYNPITSSIFYIRKK